ncbi:MAG: carbohydrate-binding protein, partial [Gammaproteobacteria bacterium]|nr:carbohydrate-binding protein [Gammaproteobacteria bacterium]
MSSNDEMVSPITGRTAQMLVVPQDADLLVWQAEEGTIIDVGGRPSGAVTEVVSGSNARPGAVDNAYVDLGRDPGDGVQYDISVDTAGSYQLTLRYANGSNSDRPLALQVDGGVTTSVSFPGTGGWSSWQEVTVELELEPGSHQLFLSIPTAEQGGVGQGPNLDQLTLVKVEDEPDP